MPHSFTRDKTFWAIALQVTILNFFLGGFGPAQPLLRADQGTSLTIAGLHGTAMGIAGICAGLGFEAPQAERRAPKRTTHTQRGTAKAFIF